MEALDQNNCKRVVLGEIVAHFGVKGWLKVRSYTRPIEQIFDYSQWQLIDQKNDAKIVRCIEVFASKKQGKNLIVKLSGLDSREDAQAVIGTRIAIDESLLQRLPDGEYYWRDLLDMNVVSQEGAVFGKVTGFLETGANDVLVVSKGSQQKDEVLIPWIDGVVVKVDRDNSQVVVDWQEAYF